MKWGQVHSLYYQVHMLIRSFSTYYPTNSRDEGKGENQLPTIAAAMLPSEVWHDDVLIPDVGVTQLFAEPES